MPRDAGAFRKILESDKDPLFPVDIAPIIGVSAYSITLQARDDPSKLGFPVTVIGTRTMIPRYAFLGYCREVLGMGR